MFNPLKLSVNHYINFDRQNWLVSLVVGVCGSIMWRKASVAALLALTVGYFYNGTPDLPAQILQYISLPNFQSSSQSQSSPSGLEQVISAAWETMITLPTRQWSRVAVGWVRELDCFCCCTVFITAPVPLHWLCGSLACWEAGVSAANVKECVIVSQFMYLCWRQWWPGEWSHCVYLNFRLL